MGGRGNLMLDGVGQSSDGRRRGAAIAEEVLGGSVRGVARLLTMLEDGAEEAEAALSRLYAHTGGACVVGVTGPLGSGKSTLIDRMAEEYRRRDRRVGILAVDPSSPFTGGAVLGDRVRMGRATQDTDTFMRSFASRGEVGGLCKAVSGAVTVLDAFGKEIIFVETIGVGQDEVEVIGVADVVLLVVVPELGDVIQLMKAGLMEIGDVFVVNKAEKPGARQVDESLRGVIEGFQGGKRAGAGGVVSTVATRNEGITELVDRVDEFLQCRKQSGEFRERRKEIAKKEAIRRISEKIRQRLVAAVLSKDHFEKAVEGLTERRLDMQSYVDQVVSSLLR